MSDYYIEEETGEIIFNGNNNDEWLHKSIDELLLLKIHNDSEIDGIIALIEKFKSKLEYKQNASFKIKEKIMYWMEQNKIDKINVLDNALSVKLYKNRDSKVIISDIASLDDKFKKVKTDIIADKRAIADYMKTNEISLMNGAHIEYSHRLDIK